MIGLPSLVGFLQASTSATSYQVTPDAPIPAGTSVRFEPGVSMQVSLVALAGARVIPGLRPEWSGPLDGPGGAQ